MISKPLIGVWLIAGAFMAALLVDSCTLRPSGAPIVTKVVARSHGASRLATGTGVDSKGRTIVTTTNIPEVWEVVVQGGDTVYAIKCNPLTWADCEPGSEVKVQCFRGLIGMVSEMRIVATSDKDYL